MKIDEAIPKVGLMMQTLPNNMSAEAYVVAIARSSRSKKPFDEIVKEVPEDEVPKYIEGYMKLGHWTPFEFVKFDYKIEGISRAESHEHVRTRTAAFLQQSQRHVNPVSQPVVFPQTIKDGGFGDEYIQMVNSINDFYERMVEAKVPKEDARYILYNASTTRIMQTINARNLVHFLKLRTAPDAHWEIRGVANLMKIAAGKYMPTVFNSINSKYWW